MKSLLAIAALAVVAAVAFAISVSDPIRVIDGDTVAVGNQVVRLVGLNAPETGARALCPAERALGRAAKARLLALVEEGSPRLTLVPCACKAGTHGTRACNSGRRCGVLRIDGRDVADILIGEGLAVAFHCGTHSCPRLPRPWCAR